MEDWGVMKKPRRIDRNHYDFARVLEIVADQTDYQDETEEIDRHELLRLLEESAQAYSILRDDAREMWRALEQAGEIVKDKRLLSLLW